MVSFTTPAASAAWCRTAPPTRFTRAIGDCERDELLLLDERFADDFRLDDFRLDDFFAPPDRAVGRLLELFFAAPRALGRRADDFFAPLFFAPLRFAPPRLAPRFAPPFLAPLRFAPERLPPLLARFAPPRDDLARVAMCVYPREGCNGRNRNFRAQAEVLRRISRKTTPNSMRRTARHR
jgi:hypothetical protein